MLRITSEKAAPTFTSNVFVEELRQKNGWDCTSNIVRIIFNASCVKSISKNWTTNSIVLKRTIFCSVKTVDSTFKRVSLHPTHFTAVLIGWFPVTFVEKRLNFVIMKSISCNMTQTYKTPYNLCVKCHVGCINNILLYKKKGRTCSKISFSNHDFFL